jgi:hypothetical protein
MRILDGEFDDGDTIRVDRAEGDQLVFERANEPMSVA